VLLCTGKVYYTLDAAREKDPRDDVAIIRVEQLYPFPEESIRAAVDRYGRADEIAWVQEEPENRGAWTFMEPRLRAMFPDTLINYYGRDRSASPAVGSIKIHQQEEKDLVSSALGVRPQAVPAQKGTPATAATQTAASQ
jgi:2-oxoglutarate dehydrogenase E1 component